MIPPEVVEPGAIDAAATTTASELQADSVTEHFRMRISRDFARAHLIVSQGGDESAEHVAVAESVDEAALFNLGVRLGKTIEPRVAGSEAIAAVIDATYAAQQSTADDETIEDGAASTDVDRLLDAADRDVLSTQGKGPIVKLVDAMLFEALRRHASDVHIQPLEDSAIIRYRLDGVLHTVREVPPSVVGPIISRIKVMGQMDIAEKRIAQDGRATVTLGTSDRRIDLRISTLPTKYGERAVVRLLDHAHQLCDFDRLQMPADVAEPYLACARRANGIILITGPTGSGKTTTLYSTLNEIGSPVMNIMTIEDPIEYDLSSVGLPVSQAQVNVRKGITFASGLRHILRQDPDVVMVGEIRDAETARIAIQASLTGHLVFSTLHTNDSASAVTRLIDLGVEPYLVSASLSAVLAQRLVRTIHQTCDGNGCDACFDTGLHGRRGLFELLVVDETIRSLIARDADLAEIRRQARASESSGTRRTLFEDGQRLVSEGVVTDIEVQRVTQEVV